MLIPKYWAKASQDIQFPKSFLGGEAKTGKIFCWRWSESSEREARERAELALKKRAESLQLGNRSKPKDQAEYFETAVREEILREFRAADGKLLAAVTQSSLGFRVLNTSDLAFVDMDYDLSPDPWFLVFFKKKQSPADLRAQWENAAVERAHNSFVAADLGGRLYRTANGLRAMVTSRPLTAKSQESSDLLYECGSDALYKKLCLAQDSFRARLTPKPRRIQLSSPGIKFPYATDEERQKLEVWKKNYESQSRNFGTCEFIRKIGKPFPIPTDFQEIIEVHDQETRALEKCALK
jgi:hypothetical protein